MNLIINAKILFIYLPTNPIGEKGRTLGKTYMGLKPGAIGNTLGEHIGNLRNIWGI
jgi:hypothetical protein